MGWQQIKVAAAGANLDQLEALCLDAGASAVTLTDAGDMPVLEPAPGETPLWPDVILTALFDEDDPVQEIAEKIRREFAAIENFSVSIEALPDRHWEREWLKDFAPRQFGERLWVCPHGQPPNAPDAIELFLDPGLAFGTGTHPTTALCLEWLAGLDLAGKRLIDFGCGSGILGVAALLLGAESVVATDIDPQALAATQSNAEANAVADRLNVVRVDAIPAGPYDVVVANILASTLIAEIGQLTTLCAADGAIGLSGILRNQADAVVQHYRADFSLDAPLIQGGWALLKGQRRNPEKS